MGKVGINSQSSSRKDAKVLTNQDKPNQGMNYKSNESQADRGYSNVADTSSGEIRQNKRSTPVAGIYHSEGQNRGGQMTKNYDSKADTDCECVNPSLEATRNKQDRAGGGAND